MIFIERILLTRARALLASNSEVDRERSIALLKQLRHDAESAHRWWLCVRVLALLALAYDAQGRPEAAMSTVQEAIALAAPRGLLRAFVDFGPAMERLLRRFIRVGGASRFVSQILAAFPAPEPRIETPPRLTALDDELIERLSDRELEILRLMYQHLNNEDIGERLSISPLTVKRHSINIYGKLGVSSRRSAILKGSALGLLPRI
jgi:LuxR family maltose regulon positive regulatory protein